MHPSGEDSDGIIKPSPAQKMMANKTSMSNLKKVCLIYKYF